MTKNANKNATIKYAFNKTLPVALSYVFIAMAFGILMDSAGYPFYWALASSVFIFSGAFQLMLVAFLAADASIATVLLTAFFMGSRHLFYGLPLLEDFKKVPKKRPYMIFALTDEVFSLDCSLPSDGSIDRPEVMFYMALFAHGYWIAGTLFGSLLGRLFTIPVAGLDFCLTALFITIVLDQWKAYPHHRPALVGFAISIICLLLIGADRFIMPAILIAVGLLTLMLRHPEKGAAQ